MKFDFSSEEMSVLLISLIRRRINVKDLLKISELEASRESYIRELDTVESILEKLFPGSIKSIEMVEKAA